MNIKKIKRDEFLMVKVTAREKLIVEKAAKASGRTISAFIRENALNEARRIVRELEEA